MNLRVSTGILNLLVCCRVDGKRDVFTDSALVEGGFLAYERNLLAVFFGGEGGYRGVVYKDSSSGRDVETLEEGDCGGFSAARGTD